nr:MAG TPA: hypothetical protein [Caudoviricetes sp.]
MCQLFGNRKAPVFQGASNKRRVKNVWESSSKIIIHHIVILFVPFFKLSN